MGTHEGKFMSSEHHVVVSWSGSAAESKPMIELLEQAGYAFTVKNEDATHLEIVVESESMRGLRMQWMNCLFNCHHWKIDVPSISIRHLDRDSFRSNL